MHSLTLVAVAISTSYWVETFSYIDLIMKKKLIAICAALLLPFGSIFAQKVVLVDMEYLLSKNANYTQAISQVEGQSKKWQGEVTKLEQEASILYQNFQNEVSRLTPEQKKLREEAIIAKEKSAYELKRKYFAPEGELYKYRERLIKPIQDKIWTSIKTIALNNGLGIVLDKSSGKIIYADPNMDISAAVLQQLAQ